MKLTFAAVALLVASAGCAETPAPPCDDGTCAVFDEDVRYERLADEYDDASQCPANGLPNCHAVFEFCANGGFTLVLTDIVEEGTYVREGNDLTMTFQPDATSGFEAMLRTDGTMDASEIGGRHPWLRIPLTAPDAAQLADTCAALEGRSWFPDR
jgi:hypothetical protein